MPRRPANRTLHVRPPKLPVLCQNVSVESDPRSYEREEPTDEGPGTANRCDLVRHSAPIFFWSSASSAASSLIG